MIGAFLIVGGSLGGVGGQLDSIQRNDAAAYLPASAEATRVLNDSKNFTGESTAAIVVYRKDSPITDVDKRDIVPLLPTMSLIANEYSHCESEVALSAAAAAAAEELK